MTDIDKTREQLSQELAAMRQQVAALQEKLQQERKRTGQALNEAIGSVEDEIAQTETIIAALGDGISIQDTHFKILYQNQVHKDMVGDHLGSYCYEAYQRADAVCAECPVRKSFLDGETQRQERTVNGPNGTIYVEVTASPLRDSSTGKIVAGVEIVRDVTARKRAEQERERLIEELKSAIAQIRTLSGLLPICAACKNIRDDKGYWNKLEQYIQKHSEAEFTHGICPDCAKRLYPDIYNDMEPGDSMVE